MMHTTTELITPEKARKMLEKNTRNRTLRKMYVDVLARKMRDGLWHLSHQGIAFGPDGTLMDGQHRLSAIVLSGISAWMLVSYDVIEVARECIDIHVRRQLQDLMNLPKRQLEPLTFIFHMMHRKEPTVTTEPSRILPYADAFLRLSQELQTTSPSSVRRLSAAPVRAAAILCAADRSVDYAFEQYRMLTLQRSEHFPTIMHHYMRYLNQLRTLAQPFSWEAFCKGLKAFDPAFANTRKLTYRNIDDDLARAENRVRALIKHDHTEESPRRVVPAAAQPGDAPLMSL